MYKIKDSKRCTFRENKVNFNLNGDTFQTIGDRIERALLYGEDVGLSMSVEYDEDDTEDVDVTTSPNHDFFDIAEQFGKMIEQGVTPPAPNESEEK